MCVSAVPAASAASLGGASVRPRRRTTMKATCCFSAVPWPTMADLTWAGVYGWTETSALPRVARSTPRLSARMRPDFGFRPLKPDSTAAQSGASSVTTRANRRPRSASRAAWSVPFGRMVPKDSSRVRLPVATISAQPVARLPGSTPKTRTASPSGGIRPARTGCGRDQTLSSSLSSISKLAQTF